MNRVHKRVPAPPLAVTAKPPDTPLNLLLDRLDNVHKYGQGYRACCPAHESKSRSSLSIRQSDDGRVLLHCFGGCSALQIVHALGLELKDLFERPITANMPPQEQRRIRQLAKQGQWKAAIKDLPEEITVLEMAAVHLVKGQALNERDRQRLMLASERIRSARAVLCEC
jgi:hypothetical protein